MLDAAAFARARTVIGRAFETDPLAQWVFPDPADRAERTALWLGRVAERFASCGQIEVDDAASPAAVAVYELPGAPDPDEVLPAVAAVTVMLVGTERAAELGAAFRDMHERAPQEPALYLQFLAVDPASQGQGRGSAMLKRVLAVATEHSLPVHLETMTERNVALYRGHGFEIVDEFELLGGGPRTWTMRHPA